MKTPLLVIGVSLILAGCATIEQNRAQNAALDGELNTLVDAWNQKAKTARPILVIGDNVTRPNYVGGVGATIAFQNTSLKPIKYIRFTVTAINRVGDQAPSSVDGESIKTLTATGPFAPGFETAGDGLGWGPVWYNNTIAFMRLDRVDVDFMDGTQQSVTGDALKDIQLRPENNAFESGIQQSRRVWVAGTKMFIERLDVN